MHITTHDQSVAAILAERARQARERLDQWETVCAAAEDDPNYDEWCIWRAVLEIEADAATDAARRAAR